MINLKITIGRMEIETSTTDLKHLVREAAFFSELPTMCPVCQEEVAFTYRTPKDFEYFGMKCLGTPSHHVNFGEYKDALKGLYYKNEGWTEGYTNPEPTRETQGNTQQTRQEAGPLHPNNPNAVHNQAAYAANSNPLHGNTQKVDDDIPF